MHSPKLCKNPIRYYCLALVLASLSSFSSPLMAEPTKAQTEKWLTAHLEAWDDENEPIVKVSDCVIQRTTRTKSHVLNVAGLLLPLETLHLDDKNQRATVRARVQDPRSAKYAMSRECNQENEWCRSPKGKFNPERFIDYSVTYYRPYDDTSKGLTARKAHSLIKAINHYAHLCNNSYRSDEEKIGF
jgi:hypothetical protein